MDNIRRAILDVITERGLMPNMPDVDRRLLTGQLLIHFPDISYPALRARLNRALANPREKRGGKRKGAGAPKGNNNAKKHGVHK